MHATLGIITSERFKNGQDLYDSVLNTLYNLSDSSRIIDSYSIGYNCEEHDSSSSLMYMDYIDPNNDWGYASKFASFGVPVTLLDDAITMVDMKDMTHLTDEQLFELRPHTLLEALNYEPWVIIENKRFIFRNYGRSYSLIYPFWKERLRHYINAGNYFTVMDYHF